MKVISDGRLLLLMKLCQRADLSRHRNAAKKYYYRQIAGECSTPDCEHHFAFLLLQQQIAKHLPTLNLSNPFLDTTGLVWPSQIITIDCGTPSKPLMQSLPHFHGIRPIKGEAWDMETQKRPVNSFNISRTAV